MNTMNTPSNPAATTPKRTATVRPRKPARTRILDGKLDVGQLPPEHRRQAACVLEVLAGLRTPEQAAAALGVSLPTYYNLETRALRGLAHGCVPQPPGRTVALAARLQGAEQRCIVLEQQVRRYQALLRHAQRGLGLAAPPAPATTADAKAGNVKRRRKRPALRALRVIESLNRPAPTVGPPAPPPSSSPSTPPSTAESGGDGILIT